MSVSPLLEICVDSLASARAAQAGGADRIELCSGLSLGGLSPSLGLIQTVRAAVDIPIYALIRPRAGDFCYSADEVAPMCADIQAARAAGVDGLVIGALTPTGQLDLAVLARLQAVAGELPLTFHRAFDVAVDPLDTVRRLAALGFSTLLTSGQASSAWQGRHLIRDLQAQVGDTLGIMAGAGVKADHVGALLSDTGIPAVHASASQSVAQHFAQGAELFEVPVRATQVAQVAALKAAIHDMHP